MKVSAIIPCYNYAEFLGAAIDSVLTQTYPPHEIIVVDDGSTDSTEKVARGYDSAVRYIRTENRGVSAARNTGIALATGDAIAFLDSDDRWLPCKLERQVPLLLGNPRIGLVHAKSRVFDHLTGEILCEPELQIPLDVHSLINRCAVSASTAMVPRRIFSEVGGFDEAFSNAADWDMWIRIADRYDVAAYPDVLSEYRSHDDSMSRGNDLKQLRECMDILDKAGNLHRHCALCDQAIRSARRRLRAEHYDRSSAIARACLRKGDYLEGLVWRLRSFWHYPEILFRLQEILQERLRRKKQVPREA